ncbi:MAG: hypothetical protein PVJ92_02290 [Candidatus Dependentiae bacterium]
MGHRFLYTIHWGGSMVCSTRFCSFVALVTIGFSSFSSVSTQGLQFVDSGVGLHGHQSAIGQTLQEAFCGDVPVGMYASIGSGMVHYATMFYSSLRLGGRFDLGYGTEKDASGLRSWASIGMSQERVVEEMNNLHWYYKKTDEISSLLTSRGVSTTMTRAACGISKENERGTKVAGQLVLDVPFDAYSSLVFTSNVSGSLPLSQYFSLEACLTAAHASRTAATLMDKHADHLPRWVALDSCCYSGLAAPASKIIRQGTYTSIAVGCWYRNNGFFGGVGLHSMTLTSRTQPLNRVMMRQASVNEEDKTVNVSFDPKPVANMEDVGTFVCAGYQGSFFKIMCQVTGHETSIISEPTASVALSFTF